jgi:hypothetical protein
VALLILLRFIKVTLEIRIDYSKKTKTMKHIVLFAFILITTFTFGQKIKLKVTGQKDTTVFLIKYYGKNLLYADTAEMKNGIVEFKGSKQKPGILDFFFQDKSTLSLFTTMKRFNWKQQCLI